MLVRAVVQRVDSASVEVSGRTVASTGPGLHVYLGVAAGDADADADLLVEKVAGLRVFADEAGRMNRDVCEVGGSVLVVSAFTVCADARKGRRPSFDSAAPAESARSLYERFCEGLAALGVSVARGEFGADMRVRVNNNGPVCVLLDSRRAF